MYSEHLNVDVRRSWTDSDLMPRLPLLGTGLSPIIQWVVIPAYKRALWTAASQSRLWRHRDKRRLPRRLTGAQGGCPRFSRRRDDYATRRSGDHVGPAWRARAALFQAAFLAVLGIGVLAATVYRAIILQIPPEAELMGVFGIGALIVNVISAGILLKDRRRQCPRGLAIHPE